MESRDVTAPAVPAELIELRLGWIDRRVAQNRLDKADADRLRNEALWRIDDFGAALDEADKLHEDMILYFRAEPADEETADLFERVRARLARQGRLRVLNPSSRRGSPSRPAPRQRVRPRERRAGARSRSRAPTGSDDGPEPPPATAGRYSLTCECCGDAFTSARPHTRTCSHRCRQRLYVQSRHSGDEALLQLGDAAWQLVSAGELSPDEALGLIIWPPSAVKRALAEAAA